MKILSFEDFKKNAKPGFRVPLVAEILNDLETPVSIYGRFAKEKYSFLLESVEHGEKWGRYSFVGIRPSLIFKSRGQNVEVIDRGKKTVKKVADPLKEFQSLLSRHPYASKIDKTRFLGGAVGLVSYDMVRFFEKIQETEKVNSDTPDLYFILPKILLVSDNLEQSLKIVCDVVVDRSSLKAQYDKSCRLIRQVVARLHRPWRTPKRKKKNSTTPQWTASLSREEHKKGVEKIREYIFAGDITQAVFSIRFESAVKDVDPLSLYRTLRKINPSPYMFLLKYDDVSLVGASPETMVRLEEGELMLRPIAGTRRRGRNDAEDRVLEKELLADKKERAEHIMLVDLGRNDLGRVAASGTVRVEKLMTVERYSHVMHIVSDVRAQLAEKRNAFDVLRATFPAGTLSGSPKVRAMQIIEELEPVRRGFYGGCVGYFSFSENMDMAITIRSALVQKDKITVQAGGGIVADSVPEDEYQEVVNKSKAVMKAVELCFS